MMPNAPRSGERCPRAKAPVLLRVYGGHFPSSKLGQAGHPLRTADDRSSQLVPSPWEATTPPSARVHSCNSCESSPLRKRKHSPRKLTCSSSEGTPLGYGSTLAGTTTPVANKRETPSSAVICSSNGRSKGRSSSHQTHRWLWSEGSSTNLVRRESSASISSTQWQGRPGSCRSITRFGSHASIPSSGRHVKRARPHTSYGASDVLSRLSTCPSMKSISEGPSRRRCLTSLKLPFNVFLGLNNRELKGKREGSTLPPRGLTKVPSHLIFPLSACLAESMRASTAILGFTKDGTQVVSLKNCVGRLPLIEMWWVGVPLQLTRPAWQLRIMSDLLATALHGVRLTMVQSDDCGLLVCAATAPRAGAGHIDIGNGEESESDDTETEVFLTIAAPPHPSSMAGPGKCPDSVILSFIAPAECKSVGAQDLHRLDDPLDATGGVLYLLTINTADSIRFLKLLVQPEVDDLSLQGLAEDSATEGGESSRQLEVNPTVLKASNDWWGTLEPLQDTHLPSKGTGVTRLVSEKGLDLEPLLAGLLASQPSTKGIWPLDYAASTACCCCCSGRKQNVLMCLAVRSKSRQVYTSILSPEPCLTPFLSPEPCLTPFTCSTILMYSLEVCLLSGDVTVLSMDDTLILKPRTRLEELCDTAAQQLRKKYVQVAPSAYVLSNEAVLRGEPVQYLVNPAMPLAIRNDGEVQGESRLAA
ncbi:unnamed protein product [Chrysoparadoxa australica]